MGARSDLSQRLDWLMDRTIIPGYSELGYRARRRRWNKLDPRPGSLAGKRALVTGAGGGIGEAAVLGLARLGATVHMVGRSKERVQPARERVAAALSTAELEAKLEPEACDVSDLTAVMNFADDLLARADAIDIVVHNAGVMPDARTLTADGHELAVATHVLGPIALTERLSPALARADAGARVIFVASGGMYGQRLHTDDFEYASGDYRPAVAYARSKRMQVELVRPLAERWAADGVNVYAMHPGWVATPGIAASLPGFSKLISPIMRDPEGGADSIVWLAATDPAPRSGTFWQDRAERPLSYFGFAASTSQQLADLEAWACQAAGAPE